MVRLNAGVASPAMMAREMGLPIGRISHHVRALAAVDAIELVETRQRRGAVEHFYRARVAAWFTDADWERVPESLRGQIAAFNVENVLRDVAAAAAGSGFRHAAAHVSYVPLTLDDQAMAEMSELLTETLNRAYAIESRSAARAGEPLSTELVLLHFERPRPA
jgi:hypothetical protein